MKYYVYFVKNKSTGLKYIGAKYSKDADPNTFWKTYFTSSKMIKNLIEVYGYSDFEFKILKTFDNKFETLKYEKRLLNIAALREDYLNISKGFVPPTEEDFLLLEKKMYKIRSFYGKLQAIRKTGYHSLSEERKKQICSNGGLKAAEINRELKRAIFDENVRKKQHDTLRLKKVSAYYDPELKKEICSKGGKNGLFSKEYAKRNGLSEEDMIKAQSERGKKGGVKNKGFIWYNDGKNLYKYTKKQQDDLSFEQFLKNNPKFYKGKIKNNEN